MGRLSRFDLKRINKDFQTTCLFETGTFYGDGVATALEAGYAQIYSAEIIPEIAEKAKARFTSNSNVEILISDSTSAIEKVLPGINGHCVFWLDAHFPGADAGLVPYDSMDDEAFRLPLEYELKRIAAIRKNQSDVFLIDDLRIYEDGPFENGNVPADALPKGTVRNIDFIIRLFSYTHYIFRSYCDEGYIILLPKKSYNKAHFSLKRLFGLKDKEDHYIL